MDILSVNLNNDDVSFDEGNPKKLLFMSGIWFGVIDISNANHVKKRN